MPKISVIIPTFNRAEMVVSCVRSVLSTKWPDLEIIVVDDCSPDETGASIRSEFGDNPSVQYIRNERNSFQAVSRNVGAARATGDYLFFLDDDNCVEKPIFDELMAAFSSHPQAGLIAPMSVHQREGRRNLIWTLGSDFNRWTSQPKDNLPNLPLEELPAGVTLYPTTYSPNAFMVPRTVFDRVGGFDESYIQIFEESDFGWRIMEAGYEGYILTTARTRHYGFLESGCVPELRQLGIEKPFRTYCFARNRLHFARRHMNVLQVFSIALIFAPLSCVYYGFVAIRNGRPDIAWKYLAGTLRGVLDCLKGRPKQVASFVRR